jgi:hypothetical protein
MIEFDIFLLKLRLFKWDGGIVDGVAVRVQYYSFMDSDWITVYGDTIKGGYLNISRMTRFPTSEEAPFFELISTGKMPPMRIVPRDPIASGLTKQPVIGSAFVFKLETDSASGAPQFTVDFGTMHLIPNDMILDSSTDFTEILPVANYFPLTITTSEPEEPETTPVPIQDLYANLVSEIATATDSADGLPFKLSNISLKLKALVHGDGESLSASLLTLENSENVNGEAISELVFDITPVSNRDNNVIAIPNLLGLTETAVRKLLKDLGLKLNPVYQKKASVVNGDSFRQFPAPGTSVEPNQLVTVIFNKHE